MIGFGPGAAVAPSITLAVELTPTRCRTFMPGLMVVFATVGTLVASGTAASCPTISAGDGPARFAFSILFRPGILSRTLATASISIAVNVGKSPLPRRLSRCERQATGGSGGKLSNMKNEFTGCGPFLHDDPRDRPVAIYGGQTSIHWAGDRDNYVLLPIIPARG